MGGSGVFGLPREFVDFDVLGGVLAAIFVFDVLRDWCFFLAEWGGWLRGFDGFLLLQRKLIFRGLNIVKSYQNYFLSLMEITQVVVDIPELRITTLTVILHLFLYEFRRAFTTLQ